MSFFSLRIDSVRMTVMLHVCQVQEIHMRETAMGGVWCTTNPVLKKARIFAHKIIFNAKTPMMKMTPVSLQQTTTRMFGFVQMAIAIEISNACWIFTKFYEDQQSKYYFSMFLQMVL